MTDEPAAGTTGPRTRRGFLAATGAVVTASVAGCQSDSGDTTSDGTPEPLAPPDGTSDSGIDAPETLVEATQTALANNDYDTSSSLGQADLTVDQSRRSSLDDQRQLQTFETETEANRIFVADGTAYVRSARDGEVTYNVGEIRGSFEDRHRRRQLGGTESLGGILEQGSYTPADTVRRNGRRVRRFTADSAQLPSDSPGIERVDGSVLVDADSVVHEASLALTVRTEDGTEPLDRSFAVEALGAIDVAEPDWVETARQQQE